MQRIIPNFFIVGAPKSGTTALSEYLRAHDNIFFSRPKEPHFFATDFNGHRGIKLFEEYQRLFATCADKHIAVGEGSVWYLYSEVAIKNIFAFNKQAKIIVMLRNPVELVYSFHSQALCSFYENEKRFEVAWGLQEIRKNGEKIPQTCRQPEFLQYAKVGMLGEQLERVYETFPRDQVKVILFDDFKTDTKRVYGEVLSFLGIPEYGPENFPIINAHKGYRIISLSRILQDQDEKPTPLARKIGRVLAKIPGGKRLPLRKTLLRLNKSAKSRSPLSPSFRRVLINTYRSDIEKLSRLLDKDLSHWCR